LVGRKGIAGYDARKPAKEKTDTPKQPVRVHTEKELRWGTRIEP
jgi:hypothetical protein